MDLPPLTQEPILHVDLTPDEDLPLRILQAYSANCDCIWEAHPPSLIYDMMNEHSRQRKEILERAIARLRTRS